MSKKLRELQEQLEAENARMEQELALTSGGSSGGGNGESEEQPRDTAIEVNLPAGRQSQAVDDPEGEAEAERRALLRRKQSQKQAETLRMSPGKIAAIVAVGVVVALLLLLLLFSGDSEEVMESTKPLSVTELKAERPHNPCPDPWWIPEQCQGEERIKSRSVWDECKEFFDKYEYNVKYLKKCGIAILEGKVPKPPKAKKGKKG